MRPVPWLVTTILTAVVAVGAVAGANAALDIYGLYRPARGRQLPVLGDARVSKYLLSLRYVPENFNAILSGASISANWDVRGIQGLRVYNESLNGGNIVEEKAVIEAALERPGVQVAFLIEHPALTYSHEYRTVEMTPALERSALGSASLVDAYKDLVNIQLGRLPRTFDFAGTETFLNARSEMNINMKQMWSAAENFVVDPVALQAHRKLIADLRAHGVKIVFIVPPTAEDLFDQKRVPMDRYMRMIHADIGGGYLWIDFLAPEYRELRRRSNFSDGVHLTAEGAKLVVGYINTAVNQWIREQRLTVASR